MGFMTNLARRIGLLAALACLVLYDAAASSPGATGPAWQTEPGVSPPSYAVTEPAESDVNVDTIALVCSEESHGRTLELDLYLSGPGPLLPNGADPRRLKERPSVEIVIDGRTFPADLLFTEGYVVVADATRHRGPMLSTHLLDAMQAGRSMRLQFDLLDGRRKDGMRFDGHVLIDLEAGRSAIAEVRRCVSPPAASVASL